ncbi:homoserine kinase [Fundidesulfovibrio butyratiphilus]
MNVASFAPQNRVSDERCVSLIGIAGAGKSTVGRLLADRLGWAHLDTDRLIEATWGNGLQALMDEKGLKGFLALEEAVVTTMSVRRTVISTGGSVVYSRKAVNRLRGLGAVIHLDIELDTFLKRVSPTKERAFVRSPGLSLAEVYTERQPLYRTSCDFTVCTSRDAPERSASLCAEKLAEFLEHGGRKD